MAASSDPWASVFLNAAGEAPPECQVEKEVSNVERQDSSAALDAFLEKGKKMETGALEHKFDAHVIDKFRSAFCHTHKNKHRTTQVVKIKNALPREVAIGALHCIKSAGDKQWSLATPDTDTGSGGSNKIKDGAGSTAHRYEVGDGTVVNSSPFAWRSSRDEFLNTRAPVVVKALCSCMQNLLPDRVGIFQAAKYTRGCFIEPHDDVAFKDIVGEDGVKRRYERDIAVIYYLTKDWHYELGGNFVDLSVGGDTHTPIFNSLVAFLVPRLHEVDMMKTDRNRITIFGWFYKLAKGKYGHNSGNQSNKKRKKSDAHAKEDDANKVTVIKKNKKKKRHKKKLKKKQ